MIKEQNRKKILIVDDDEVVRSLLTRIVKKLGGEVVCAGSSGEALTKLKESPAFDLIIMDLIMPGESGWEFLNALHRNTDLSEIPVVVITGVLLSENETKKLRSRACAVVQKGLFDVENFRKLVDDLI
ncbi:MAG: response regulator [Kiritimatiellia bacterium]